MSSIYDDIDLDAIEAEYNATAHQREGYGREDRAMLRRLNPEKYDSDSRLKDTAIDIGQGIIGLGDIALGVGDIVTGGAASRWAREHGWESDRWREDMALDYSFKRQDEEAEYEASDGFTGAVTSYLSNPMMMAGHLVQQVPGLLATGGAGALGAKAAIKASAKAAPYLSGVYKEGLEMAAEKGLKYQAAEKFAEGYAKRMAAQAGAQWGAAVGEGTMAAGSVASAISEDAMKEGRETGYGDYGWAVAAGLTTGALGKYIGGKAGGGMEAQLGARMAGSAVETAGEGSFLKSVRQGIIAEGIKEEMPQSGMEQIYQNLGTGEDMFSGVTKAMGQGAVMGGAMGGVFGGVNHFAGRAKDTHNIIGGANPTAAEAQASSEGEAAANQEIDTKVNSTLQAIQNSPYGALQGANPVDTPVPMADPEERLLPSQMPAGGVEELVADLRAQGVPESQIKKHIDWMQANGQLQQPGMASNEVPRPRASAISVDPSEQRYRDFQTHQLEDKVAADNEHAAKAKEETAKMVEGVREEANKTLMLPAPDGQNRHSKDNVAYAKRQLEKANAYYEEAKGTAAEESAKGILQRAQDYYTAVMNERPKQGGAISEKPSDAGRRYNESRYAEMHAAELEADAKALAAAEEEAAQRKKNSARTFLASKGIRFDSKKDNDAIELDGDIDTRFQKLNEHQRKFVELAVDTLEATGKGGFSARKFNDFVSTAEKNDDILTSDEGVLQLAEELDATTEYGDARRALARARFGKKPTKEEAEETKKNANPIRKAAAKDSAKKASDEEIPIESGPYKLDTEKANKLFGKGSQLGEVITPKRNEVEEDDDIDDAPSASSRAFFAGLSAKAKGEESTAETKKPTQGVVNASFGGDPSEDYMKGIGIAKDAKPVEFSTLWAEAREDADTKAFDFDTEIDNAEGIFAEKLEQAKRTYDGLMSGRLGMYISNVNDGNYKATDANGVQLPMIAITAAGKKDNYKVFGGVKQNAARAAIFKHLFVDMLNTYQSLREAGNQQADNGADYGNVNDSVADKSGLDADSDALYDGSDNDNTSAVTQMYGEGVSVGKSTGNGLESDTGALDALAEVEDIIHRKVSGSLEENVEALKSAFDKLMDKLFNGPLYKNTELEPDGAFANAFKKGMSKRFYFVEGFVDARPESELANEFNSASEYPINGLSMRTQRTANGDPTYMYVPPTARAAERLKMWENFAAEIGKAFGKSLRSAEEREAMMNALFRHVNRTYVVTTKEIRQVTDNDSLTGKEVESSGDKALDDYRTKLADVYVAAGKHLRSRFRSNLTAGLRKASSYPMSWVGKSVNQGEHIQQTKLGISDGQGKWFKQVSQRFSAAAKYYAQNKFNKPLKELTVEERIDALLDLAEDDNIQLVYDQNDGYNFVFDASVANGQYVPDFTPEDFLLPVWVRASGLFTDAELRTALSNKNTTLSKIMSMANDDYASRLTRGRGEAGIVEAAERDAERARAQHKVSEETLENKRAALFNLKSAFRIGGDARKSTIYEEELPQLVETLAEVSVAKSALISTFDNLPANLRTDDAYIEAYAKAHDDLVAEEESILREIDELRSESARRGKFATATVMKERNERIDLALAEYVKACEAEQGELLQSEGNATLKKSLATTRRFQNSAAIKEAAEKEAAAIKLVRNAAKRVNDSDAARYITMAYGNEGHTAVIDGEPQRTNVAIAAREVLKHVYDNVASRSGMYISDAKEQALVAGVIQAMDQIIANTQTAHERTEFMKALAMMLDDAPFHNMFGGSNYGAAASDIISEKLLARRGTLDATERNLTPVKNASTASGEFQAGRNATHGVMNKLQDYKHRYWAWFNAQNRKLEEGWTPEQFDAQYPATQQFNNRLNGLTKSNIAAIYKHVNTIIENTTADERFMALDSNAADAAKRLVASNLRNQTATADELAERVDYFYNVVYPKYLEASGLSLRDISAKRRGYGTVMSRVKNCLAAVMGDRKLADVVLNGVSYLEHIDGDPTRSCIIDRFDEDGKYVDTVVVMPDYETLGIAASVREICHEFVHRLSGAQKGAVTRLMQVTRNPKAPYGVEPTGSAAKDLFKLMETNQAVADVCGKYPLSYTHTTKYSDPAAIAEELLAQVGALYAVDANVRADIRNNHPALHKLLKKIFEGGGNNDPKQGTAKASFGGPEDSNGRVLPPNEGGPGFVHSRNSGRGSPNAERQTGDNPSRDVRPVQRDVRVGEQEKQVTKLSKAVKATFKETSKAKVEDAISKLPPEWQNAAYSAWDMVRGFLGNLLEKLQLGLSFTKDLAAKFSEVMPSIGKLMETMQEKEAWQNAMQETLARFRNRFAAFDKTTQDAINKCLEASTLSRVWAYRPDWVSDETWKASQDNEKFAQIQAQFNALPAAAQQFVKDAFEKNHQLFVEKMDILTNKTNELFDDAIENATDEADKQSLIEDKKTALARITKLRPDADWPYMPLVRRGSHAVVARSQALIDAEQELEELTRRRIDEKGLDAEDSARVRELRKAIEEMRGNESDYIVVFVNGQGSANQAQRKLQRLHPDMHVEPFERRIETTHDAINFMSINALEDQLTARMGESNSDSNRKLIRRMLTMLNDIYIDNLADKHSRKAELHRENVAGYNPDMVANFLDQGYRETNYLGGVRYNKQIRDAMRTLQSEARMSDKGVSTDVRMRVYNEILKRQQLDYEHKPNAFVETTQRVTSLSMLLLSPAYYLQNATQPFMMSAPYMAGKHNVDKVFSHLANDMKSIAQMYFDAKNRDGVAPRIDQMFKDNPALLKALEEARAAGRIDIGMAQDFGHLQNASPFQRVTDKISNVARLTEMLNRVATFKTAFELELERTGSAELAKVYADEVLYETHGDYSNTNAPRFFRQGGMGLGAEKLIFQFRKFQLIQLGMMCRLVKNAFANADTNERKIARKALAYTMGTHMAFTGMKGTPFVMFLLAAMGLGDDDENEEDAIRRLIGDKATSDFLLGGVPAALGVDVSGRIGAGTMLSPFPFLSSKPWDSREAANEFWVSFGGPALAQANRMFEGMSYINEGDLFKGFEKMVPNGVGNAMRAYRFATEGYTTKNGTVTIPSSEFDAMDTFFQAIGLPTSVTTDRMRLQDKLIRSEEYFAREERKLNKAYRAATSAKERMEVQREYLALQKKRAEKGFTPKPVTQLVKNAQKVEKDAANNVGGVIANNSNRGLLEMWSKW